jgi:hypothetical protein
MTSSRPSFSESSSPLFETLIWQEAGETIRDFSMCKAPRGGPSIESRRGELRVAYQPDLQAVVASVFRSCGQNSFALATAERWRWSEFRRVHCRESFELVRMVETATAGFFPQTVLASSWWIAIEGPSRNEGDAVLADALVLSAQGKRRVREGRCDGTIQDFRAVVYNDLQIVYGFCEAHQTLRTDAAEVRARVEAAGGDHHLGDLSTVREKISSASEEDRSRMGVYAFRAALQDAVD